MQTILGYLYDNLIVVQLVDDATLFERNEVVYARGIKVYKGVDNVLQVQFKNQDQKPVVITGRTIEFFLLDKPTLSTHIKRDGIIVDGANGIASVTLTESELNNLVSKLYTYSLKVTDSDGTTHVIYADDTYNAGGSIELQDKVYPQFKESVEPALGPYSSNIAVTPAINGQNSLNSNEALHSAQFAFTNFTGDIEVQGTMLNSIPTIESEWFTVDTINYSGQTETAFTNFNGMLSFVRFKVTKAAGTVDTILYRA